jgi:hypothetical protein
MLSRTINIVAINESMLLFYALKSAVCVQYSDNALRSVYLYGKDSDLSYDPYYFFISAGINPTAEVPLVPAGVSACGVCFVVFFVILLNDR